MTRLKYINSTLHALCGDRPASPDEYYSVVRMADDAEKVCPFDGEDEITI